MKILNFQDPSGLKLTFSRDPELEGQRSRVLGGNSRRELPPLDPRYACLLGISCLEDLQASKGGCWEECSENSGCWRECWQGSCEERVPWKGIRSNILATTLSRTPNFPSTTRSTLVAHPCGDLNRVTQCCAQSAVSNSAESEVSRQNHALHPPKIEIKVSHLSPDPLCRTFLSHSQQARGQRGGGSQRAGGGHRGTLKAGKKTINNKLFVAENGPFGAPFLTQKIPQGGGWERTIECPLQNHFGGLRKWDSSGLCPFPPKKMTLREQNGGGNVS